jgi:hypothetical protein
MAACGGPMFMCSDITITVILTMILDAADLRAEARWAEGPWAEFLEDFTGAVEVSVMAVDLEAAMAVEVAATDNKWSSTKTL